MRTIHWNKSVAIPSFILFTTLIYLIVKHELMVCLTKEEYRVLLSRKVSNEPKEPYLDLTKPGNFEGKDELINPGPGEGGKAYSIPAEHERAADISIGKYKGICVLASDDISLTRTIPDTRMEECKYWNYPSNMGLTASIVLVFHNEGFSTLMRNVHTIFKRSPPEMIEEIILVDDCSTMEDTKEKLENYIERFKGKVKLLRNPERQGLIRTRNFGAQQAKGDVVVFLDAHCEVNRNWLPPLLAPIFKNRKTMTVPYIDKIHHKNFAYTPVYGTKFLPTGIWEWGFFYKEMDLSKEELKLRSSKSEPYKSPTHAGGLFAIDREYFKELGYYDDGLLVWGGEQYELSFKIWQCGGSILWVPCSRVGHIYRGPIPPGTAVPDTCKITKEMDGPYVSKNYKRVIEVWWEDKYKEYFYTREPLVRYLDHGDITKQLEFKEKNNCKSFQWFMENVAPGQPSRFPAPPPNHKWGGMKSVGTATCLDTYGRGPGGKLGLSGCHGQGGQLMRLNTEGQLGIGERCIDIRDSNLKLIVCPDARVDGPWKYDEEKMTMYHTKQSRCLSVNPTSKELILRKCDSGNPYSQWIWKESRP